MRTEFRMTLLALMPLLAVVTSLGYWVGAALDTSFHRVLAGKSERTFKLSLPDALGWIFEIAHRLE